ncbi:MAG: HU family DNA-binding protein [Prevotellaceae bacterium]|nr:HU family DNA-binding protein [Prevotellaceae bacterium]
MSKLNVFDLSGVLMSKNGLGDKESRRFVKAIFDVIQECLDEEKVVKVKGLGTFKIIEVDDRESINVNTGERVLIEGHSKLTFTPDSVMKEIVNKPFSQFETVILNDGVDFPEPAIEEPISEEPISEEPIPEDPILEDSISEEPVAADPGLSDKSQSEINAEQEILSPEAPIVEFTEDGDKEDTSDVVPPTDEAPTDEEINDEEESNNSTLRWVLSGVVVLLLILAAAYGGYLYGKYEISEEMAYKQMKADLKAAEMTVEKAKEAVAKDSVEQEMDATKIGAISVDKEQEDAAKDESPKEAIAKDQVAKEQPVKESADKYEAKDVRVRTGAYRIIGEDRVVKAKAGQTVEDIATRLLGPGMSCYVEVYNNLDGKTTLKEGQAIKIPKLQLKKRR